LVLLSYVALGLIVLATGAHYWKRHQDIQEVERREEELDHGARGAPSMPGGQAPSSALKANVPAQVGGSRPDLVVADTAGADPDSDTPPPILVSHPGRPAQRVLLEAASPAQLREAFRFHLFGLERFSSGLVPVAEAGKTGYLDSEGRWVFPPQFGFAGPFSDGRARVSWGGGSGRQLAGFMDTSGRWLGKDPALDPHTGMKFTFRGVEVRGHRVAQSNENGHSGVLDQSGSVVIPMEFEQLELLDTGDVWAVREGTAGVMNLSQTWLWTRPAELGSHRFQGDLGGGLIAIGDKQTAALVDYRIHRTLGTFERLWPQKEGPMPAMRQGRWGFVDRSGQWVIEPKYDSAQPFRDGRSLVSKDGVAGWIEATGKEHLFASDLTVLQLVDDGRAIAAKGCGIGVVEADGQWTIPPAYENVQSFGEGVFVVTRNAAAGLVVGSGRFLTPGLPDGPKNIREVATEVSGGGWQFIDLAGHDLGPDVLVDASDFHEGYAVVAVDARYGVIDTSGNITVPLLFRVPLHDFHEGRAAAKANWGGWGYIDPRCHWVIAPVYGQAEDFAGGTAEVARGQDQSLVWSRIDKSGQEVRDSQAQLDDDTREGLRRLALNGRWGFVDPQQQWVIPAQFDDESSFSEGAAAVERAGKWGFIDKSGKLIVPAQFDAVGDFHGGLARVKQNDRWTYVSQSGELLKSELGFRDAGDFSEGAARVMMNSARWGYINKTGGWLIEPIYAEAADFSGGRARVRLQAGPYRTIKATNTANEGKPLLLNSAGWFGSGLGYVCAQQTFNGCALINAAGELLIPEPARTEPSR
jgi:hypothetical protein